MSTVAVVAFDGIPLFHLGVPLEVFAADRTDMGVPRHTVLVVAAEAGPLRADAGVTVEAPHPLSSLRCADLVIVPSWRDAGLAEVPETLVHELRRAHERGAKVVGLCGGAFVLAAAGLLDGRRATTHWMQAPALAERYPRVRVDPDVLYVNESDIATSAGTAAAIDLCLALVRDQHGAEVASTVARRMVVAQHRTGRHSQVLDAPVNRAVTPDPIAQARTWALQHLGEAIDVDALAAFSHLSRRQFDRRFSAAVGTTPAQWLLDQRLLLARRLLERTDLSVEAVAARAGFGSAVTMRQQFVRALGASPREYRLAFRGSAADAPLTA